MFKSIFITIIFGLLISFHIHADQNTEFENILTSHWTQAEKEKVFYRTDPDAFRMNGTLPEFSTKARERREKFNRQVLRQLNSVEVSQLTPANRINFKLFKYERESEAFGYKQPEHLFPINSLFGYHTYFANAPANMSFLTLEDYKRYLVSLADFPRYNQEQMKLLEEAVELGFVHHCDAMEGYDETIIQLIVDGPEQSSLFNPFNHFPALVSKNSQNSLTDKGRALIASKVIPEYKELLDFYTQQYIPNCRQQAGIGSVKGGPEYYQNQINFFTTTNMTPKSIHQLGLSEVKRIRQEMIAIMKQVGFKGDYKSFLNYLRDEPKFYAKTEQELLGRAALISKNMEGELPKFFSFLPRGTFKIKPGSRGAYYVASTGDGKTSGTYFIGTKDLKTQPLYTLEALTFHEGVPGHHLQSAIALEQDVPEFRKTVYHSAYGEGWGLYSERLGKEMGFYQDPYSDFGRLTYEAFRAVRLVVDTGVHAFGWSRNKAIEYMLDNTGLSRKATEAQIDRYITWPAQALSYKIGELKIRALRAKAEKALGQQFDIRSFHDTVIGNGSVPIAVLEELVDEWIKNRE
ncbi:MAG: DUF885 domain-containing protein [Kangiellaceae bacterium]|nr:DUF885 domain-containing protein [Kangiellaceae bacterium]